MKKLTKRYNKRNSVEAYNCLCWTALSICSCYCICACTTQILTNNIANNTNDSTDQSERVYNEHLAQNFNG